MQRRRLIDGMHASRVGAIEGMQQWTTKSELRRIEDKATTNRRQYRDKEKHRKPLARVRFTCHDEDKHRMETSTREWRQA
jgi:hypothetical protein